MKDKLLKYNVQSVIILDEQSIMKTQEMRQIYSAWRSRAWL